MLDAFCLFLLGIIFEENFKKTNPLLENWGEPLFLKHFFAVKIFTCVFFIYRFGKIIEILRFHSLNQTNFLK